MNRSNIVKIAIAIVLIIFGIWHIIETVWFK